MREPTPIITLAPLVSFIVQIALVGGPESDERLFGTLVAAREGVLTVEPRNQPRTYVPLTSTRWVRAATQDELKQAGYPVK